MRIAAGFWKTIAGITGWPASGVTITRLAKTRPAYREAIYWLTGRLAGRFASWIAVWAAGGVAVWTTGRIAIWAAGGITVWTTGWIAGGCGWITADISLKAVVSLDIVFNVIIRIIIICAVILSCILILSFYQLGIFIFKLQEFRSFPFGWLG
ncbi:hypothetical protein HSX37_04165|uniref:hypothetical protein n=1 Tax=Dendrosporobacter quercicolus TaxID=146817 RepID=UPI000B870FE9|nr:hypothetical protein [Dendrosporobacter quercicolus]NSL47250.1 hypothetical protein [Dendrosporobacter quercicolus DSM 1736]